MTKIKTDEEIRKIVVARLRQFPSGKKISIGMNGEYSKDELIDRVEQGDKIGQKIIAVQMAYLQSLKEGILDND
ncbi:MAG: hypothetical protein AAB838_00040 [Patescibacteria group bacterium]